MQVKEIDCYLDSWTRCNLDQSSDKKEIVDTLAARVRENRLYVTVSSRVFKRRQSEIKEKVTEI